MSDGHRRVVAPRRMARDPAHDDDVMARPQAMLPVQMRTRLMMFERGYNMIGEREDTNAW